MGSRLRRASLQRGLEGLLAPQFNITDKQKRRSPSVTSGGSFYRRGPSPFVCPRSDNHCSPHKGNSKKRSFGDLYGVGGPPAGGGGGGWGAEDLLIECSMKEQLLTLFFLTVVCGSVPSLGGGGGGSKGGT